MVQSSSYGVPHSNSHHVDGVLFNRKELHIETFPVCIKKQTHYRPSKQM